MKKELCILILLSSFVLNCQQGSRKDPQSTAVYQIQTEEIELVEKKLEAKNILLSPNALSSKDINIPKEILGDEKSQGEVQVLLSDYINKTQKLMLLADEKLVLFPKKAEIQNKENQASIMLGQILGTKNYNEILELTTSGTADHSEFEIRFKRISTCTKQLTEVDLDVEQPDNFSNSIKSKPTQKLLAAQKGLDMCMGDTFRVKTLLQRNNNFNMEGLNVLENSMTAFGGVFYSANEKINIELAKRKKTKK